jgi:hypothetical protein
MRGLITTDKKHSLTQSLLQGVTALALAGVIATPAAAQGQMEGILEEIDHRHGSETRGSVAGRANLGGNHFR